VLRREAGQEHREVKPHADFAPAVVFETVHLPVGFVATLSRQHFQVFEGRRVDGAVAVGPVDSARRIDQPFARNHRRRQLVAKAFQCTRCDQLAGRRLR
jgi:hypothetical protein